MQRPRFTLRYLTRFRCIAEQCEDTCCAGMQILISDESRARLEEALSGSASDRAEVEQNLVQLPGAPHGYRWALARDGEGACRFLEPTRLCSVIRRHGDAAVPDACALFPRVVSQLPGRVEVAASLACPEVARLCLLAEDAVDSLPMEEELSRLPPMAAHHTFQDEVRAACRTLLTDRRYRLRTRLMGLAELGADLENLGAPERLAQVDARLARADTPGEPVIQALLALLTGVQQRGSARYHRLVEAVLPTYQVAALERAPGVGQPGGPPLWSVLWEVFLEKRDRADRALGDRLDATLERYWVNDLYREPYARAPSLLAHAFKMLLRGAALRFLVLGHPVVDQLAAAASDGTRLSPEHESLLAGALVETVQTFAKHVERARELLDVVDEHLTPGSLGTDALGRARMFAAAA